jgi:RimJ/RimL family protein N-acetyltransferase
MISDLTLVNYNETYLDRSWLWLNDPETRALTMTPVFSRDDQRKFFNALEGRKDYLIWGVALDDRPIGVAGLKNHRGTMAEYWGYIGEKELWGAGMGRPLMQAVECKAREAGFLSLDLKVWIGNTRAISLYSKMGYAAADTHAATDVLRMVKESLI